VALIWAKTHIEHHVEDAALYRLQTIASIRKGA
jgi:hypothetical protein